MLGPLAEHRFLTVPQLAVLMGLGIDAAEARLERLRDAGLISMRRIFDALPAAVAITARGLRLSDSALKTPPRLNHNHYAHEVGVGWLWLAARSGRFGELTRLTAERQMRAEDYAARAAGGAPPWGVGLGVLGQYGRRYHYPDLLLDAAGGQRVAIELELSRKSAQQLSPIMRAYASDARVDHILYLAGSATIAAAINSAAGRAGIAHRVHIQTLAPRGIAGAEVPQLQEVRARSPRRQPARAASQREAGR